MKHDNRNRILLFIPVVLLIGIALGFFALWQQERMLASWEEAEGLVIHLEVSEEALSDATVASLQLVFNYTANDRVYQGAVRVHTLLDGKDESDALGALRPAMYFLVTEAVGTAYTFDEEQEIPLRRFEEVRRLRVPFEHAPRLQLRHHPDDPGRYRLDKATLLPTALYPGAFALSLVVAVLMGGILYRRDAANSASSRAR